MELNIWSPCYDRRYRLAQRHEIEYTSTASYSDFRCIQKKINISWQNIIWKKIIIFKSFCKCQFFSSFMKTMRDLKKIIRIIVVLLIYGCYRTGHWTCGLIWTSCSGVLARKWYLCGWSSQRLSERYLKVLIVFESTTGSVRLFHATGAR